MSLHVLAESHLLDGLDDNAAQEVVKALRIKTKKFKRKDTLFSEGSLITSICILVDGLLLCQRFHPDGKSQIVNTYSPFDIISLEATISRKKTSPMFITASTKGSYLYFNQDDLFSSDSISPDTSKQVLINLLALAADNSIRYMNKSDILARRTARGRIFLYLSLMQSKHGEEFDITMTQDQFAQYLCLDRTSLSTELALMKHDGIIDYHGRTFRLHIPEDPSEYLK